MRASFSLSTSVLVARFANHAGEALASDITAHQSLMLGHEHGHIAHDLVEEGLPASTYIRFFGMALGILPLKMQ